MRFVDKEKIIGHHQPRLFINLNYEFCFLLSVVCSIVINMFELTYLLYPTKLRNCPTGACSCFSSTAVIQDDRTETSQ